jgi:trimethylamine--corrinoid protein Co-methyltransferase
VTQLPWRALRNPYPPVEILDPQQVEDIHGASPILLSEIGMRVQDADARAYLARAGAEVDGDTQMVRFDPGLVEEMVTGLPAEFTALARDPAKSLVVGGNAIIFGSVVGPSFVNDLDGGRRAGSHAAMCDFIRLVHSLNIIHHEGGAGMEPLDLPPESRHLDMMYAQITLTDKTWQPAWLNSRERANDAIEMACIGLGIDREELARNPTVQAGVNTNSPLVLDGAMAEGLIEMAKAAQAVDITPFTLAGAMSPVTLAGALAQQNAEVLAGFVLVQAVRRGCPVVYGHFATNVDMKTGSPAFGTPEYTKAVLASAQMARRYGVPFRSSNTTGAAVVDAQAAYEGAMSLWGTVMAHTNLVLHAGGWLEGGLTCSFEKLILDAEMLQLMAESLSPIEGDETALYAPLLSDWRDYETWRGDGAKTATERANAIWKQLLRDYEAPPLDPAIDEALKDYMAHRKEEIARTGR